ncbi:MAG: hypothetical protein OIN86_08565 [Candidatus Methanoperedens sp.]|nr:hypothetical protein [Candidatus Methanoperedens sp.]CAG0951484.1 hypothetical protein METP1_00215 [Methanosarcinales archaeon]
MLDLDFTLTKYRNLCRAIAQNYPTLTMTEYFSGKESLEHFAIIRHDIDRKACNAMNTARIEQESGIRATYYFRMNDSVFRPELIKEIEGMGHEVGYHYEVLGKSKGDLKKAIGLFETELAEFKKICNVKTICMHGNPLSKYDDRELWKTYDFKDFGIIGEAYLSTGINLNYFSDTGRIWKRRDNLQDNIHAVRLVGSTDVMIEFIEKNKVDNIYIMTHPERWASNSIGWGLSLIGDLAFNIGKSIFKARKLHNNKTAYDATKLKGNKL